MIASAEKKKSRAVAGVAVAPLGVDLEPPPEVRAMVYGGNSDYMSALIEARDAVLDHSVFTGIINADPLPITAGIDSSSGIQDPHP